MAKKVSKTLIGGFVVGAVVLIVAGVAIFGSGKFFKEKRNYVLFFQGSLKGLNKGSPVVFRGVKIGSVIDIAIQVDAEDLTVQIPVLIETDPTHFEVKRGQKLMDTEEQLPILIERGLRAQLQLQSFVTGQLIVAIDFHPDTPVNLVGIDTGYPEIPTIRTPLEQLSETLKDLPLEELVHKLTSAVEGIDKFVNSPELTGSVSSLHLALEDVRKLIRNIDSQIGPLATGIDALRGKDMSQIFRVLIVDDDKATRKFYRGILKGFPEFQLREAKNGKEALDLIGESTPDIVVSDLMMPEMDGLELCRHIKGDTSASLSTIYLIMVSARETKEDKIACMREGACTLCSPTASI